MCTVFTALRMDYTDTTTTTTTVVYQLRFPFLHSFQFSAFPTHVLFIYPVVPQFSFFPQTRCGDLQAELLDSVH